MRVSIEWRHKMKATGQHEYGDGFRSVFAWLLRAAADKADGGKSIRVEYTTKPKISPRQSSDCIERGLAHANRLLAEMAHQEACEDALRDHMGELFEDSHQ